MSRSNDKIKAIINPVRVLHLKNFEEKMDAFAKHDESITAEPIRQDEKGNVVRDGVLNLPSRADFSTKLKTGVALSDIQPAKHAEFEPFDFDIDGKLTLAIFPFSWDQVHISFKTGDDPKRLVRLRLWYLEWFQARYTSSKDELHNVVHSIRGPKSDGDTWQVCIDMGSAPIDALIELFRVLASRGVNQMTLGAELDRVGNEQF